MRPALLLSALLVLFATHASPSLVSAQTAAGMPNGNSLNQAPTLDPTGSPALAGFEYGLARVADTFRAALRLRFGLPARSERRAREAREAIAAPVSPVPTGRRAAAR